MMSIKKKETKSPGHFITESTVEEINQLNDDQAVTTIEKLKQSKHFVKGKESSRQLSIQVKVITVDTCRILGLAALIDSGSTASVID